MAKDKTIKEKLLYFTLEKTTKTIRERFHKLPVLSDNKISLEQWLIIDIIGKKQGTYQKKIIDVLSKEPASISRMINKLTNQGIITKVRSDEDKKIYRLFLSEKGSRLYDENRKTVDREFKELFSTVFERELYLVMDILKRVQ